MCHARLYCGVGLAQHDLRPPPPFSVGLDQRFELIEEGIRVDRRGGHDDGVFPVVAVVGLAQAAVLEAVLRVQVPSNVVGGAGPPA